MNKGTNAKYSILIAGGDWPVLEIKELLKNGLKVIWFCNVTDEILVKEELNVKQVVLGAEMSEYVDFEIKPNLPVLGKMYGKLIPKIKEEISKRNQMDLANTVKNGGTEYIDIDNEIRIKQSTKKGYIVANSGDGVNLSFPLSKSRRGRVIKEKSSTLDTSCNLCVYYNDVIRKLTIEELEQLQTLPIGYTDGLSYNQMQDLCGDGWTVDVIAHILKGLK